MAGIESEELWKRVGLENLRHSLEKVDALTHRFERSLQDLPQCHQCARRELLERIEKSGNDLGSEVIALSLLAASLKKAVTDIETARKDLEENTPSPCRCPDEECRCH